MLKSYFKIAFRQILKYKLFSAVNIFGLAVSMAVCLLLIMIMQDQYGYDSFHENGERIFRVISAKTEKGQNAKPADHATTALSLAEKLTTNYPFVKKTTRLAEVGMNIKKGENALNSNETGFAVDNVFAQMFSFGWIEGDQRTALQNPRSVVLTETTADQLFPNTAPLGENVEIDKLGFFTVTGVMPDPPVRSHIRFSYLMSFSTITDALTKAQQEEISIYGFDDIWRGLVYVLLENANRESQFEAALGELAVAHAAKDADYNFVFQPQALSEVVPSQDLSNEIGMGTPQMVLFFLLVLGLIIIISACFNYMNLSMARSLKRAKEIGIRKVTGASKQDIIIQFLGEAVLIALIALVVAVGLLEFMIPAFYALDPFVETVFLLEREPMTYVLFLGFSIVVGILAGIFPAFHIAGFQPVQSIKKLDSIKLFSRVGFRKALITLQFVLSLLFILTVIIVLKQQEHVLQTDLGSTVENMFNVRLNKNIDYDVFSQQVSQLKDVEAVGASERVILTGENASTKITFHNNTDSLNLLYNTVSHNYLDNLGIDLIAGNNFPANSHSQGEQFIILNKTATKRMGYEHPEEAIGQSILIDTLALNVIGVTADFYHDNIWFSPIQPFGIRHGGDFSRNAHIRLSGQNTPETITAIRQIWNTMDAKSPMLAFFVDERVYYLAKFFKMGSSIIGFVGFLTILIACLGLLGMVIYTVEGRMKEVGIRKVLGASKRSIIWQLSKGFFFLLSLAAVIAVPLTIASANLWLNNFINRIVIGPTIILSGLSILLLLGLLTVVSQTYLAAGANPAETLKNE